MKTEVWNAIKTAAIEASSEDSDAMFFAMLEEAARIAGSKDPNKDVWSFLKKDMKEDT